MKKSLLCMSALFLCVGFFSISNSPTHAQVTEGIMLENDVFLKQPILDVQDLPDEVTFALYDSENAMVPLATQTFPRRKYTLDFDVNKSDGISSGSIARYKVYFTNKLNLNSDTESPVQPKELWAEIAVDGSVVGARSRVSDDTLVQLVLASDASVATYLTLVYEGDDNPLTTIYRDLPLSTVASDGSKSSLSSYFSAVASDGVIGAANNWIDAGSSVYTNGNVGIADSAPNRALSVKYPSASGALNSLPTVSVANTHTSTGENDWSFSSFEFSGGNGTVVGEFFADGSGAFLDGTPNVYFRASTNSPILLGTNQIVRMIITKTGEVGIGTTDPGEKLEVAGNIEVSGAGNGVKFPDGTVQTTAAAPTWHQILPAADRFKLVMNSNAAVLDKETGLVWEKSPDTTKRTWTFACTYCYQRQVGGRKGWRLPTIEELASLVDTSQSNPALPEGHPFTNVQSNDYWSSTTNARYSSYAWFVYFGSGNVYSSGKGYDYYVWCVRGGYGHDAH